MKKLILALILTLTVANEAKATEWFTLPSCNQAYATLEYYYNLTGDYLDSCNANFTTVVGQRDYCYTAYASCDAAATNYSAKYKAALKQIRQLKRQLQGRR